jgi:hypothetical protein
MHYQGLIAACGFPAEGAALLHLAASKPLFNQTMTGNKSGTLLLTTFVLTLGAANESLTQGVR